MSETTKDSLGISLSTGNPMDRPPAICLYGPSGGGKSTELARAFPSALFLVSSETVLRPYVDFLAKNPEIAANEGLKVPAYKVIPKYRPGTSELIDPRGLIDAVIDKFVEGTRSGTNPYSGIVFDEWTELGFRVHEAIQADSKYGRNNFARFDALKEFHYKLARLPEQTGKALGLVCHEMEPQYDTKEGSPTQGHLLHRGGPKMPIKSLTHEVSAAMDIVLRIRIKEEVTGETNRFYDTDLKEKWISKIRAFGINSQEPLGLRALLQRAGYKL